MLFESRGCLLLLCDECNDSRQIDIYEMRNGCSEWSVKYSVDLNDIFSPFPSSWSIHSRVWSIVLGEQEADSFMVIEFQGMIQQYKPALQTFRELGDLGSVGHPYSVFQFTVSFSSAGVSFFFSVLGLISVSYISQHIHQDLCVTYYVKF